MYTLEIICIDLRLSDESDLFDGSNITPMVYISFKFIY